MHAAVEARAHYIATRCSFAVVDEWRTMNSEGHFSSACLVRDSQVRLQSGRRLLCMRSLKADTLRTILVWWEGTGEAGRARRHGPSPESRLSASTVLWRRDLPSLHPPIRRLDCPRDSPVRARHSSVFRGRRGCFFLDHLTTFNLHVVTKSVVSLNDPRCRNIAGHGSAAFNQSIMLLIDRENPGSESAQNNPPSRCFRTSTRDVV